MYARTLLSYKTLLILLSLILAVGLSFMLHASIAHETALLTERISQISSTLPKQNVYFSTYPQTVLDDMWASYKADYIQNDGRTVDKSADLITTSEGQSYSMLRSVWSDDKHTFDNVWKWTNTNLKKRTTDNLFAWKWGQISPDNWGILVSQNGLNTASDADQDIALALILGSYRWNDSYYLTQARRTLNDIWNNEVSIIYGRPYLTAGNWADNGTTITINPSYYSFAAYDLFARIDPTHDWAGVKDTSYEVLNKVTQNLPPDWAVMDKRTLDVKPADINGKGIVYSLDATRVPWRVALDWEWNKDTRAETYLNRLVFLDKSWRDTELIYQTYSLEGKPLDSNESLSMYSTLLPYLKIVDAPSAEQLLNKKLASQFNPDVRDFSGDVGYYSANWSWFGLALYEGKLVNTYQTELASK